MMVFGGTVKNLLGTEDSLYRVKCNNLINLGTTITLLQTLYETDRKTMRKEADQFNKQNCCKDYDLHTLHTAELR